MSKEKIEEMVKALNEATFGVNTQTLADHLKPETINKVAEHLYNAGYRKQSEGEWVFNRGRTYGEPAYYCSACSYGASEYGYDKFCPNCGAHMRDDEKTTKTFFYPEEVRKMSPREVRENYQAIMTSMKEWK
jgi:rubrerythrin